MKNYWNFFRHNIFQITYAMCSISILPCIMKMISNFTIFFIFQIFIFIFEVLLANIRFLNFHMILAALLLITSFFFILKSIIFIGCSIVSHKTFSCIVYFYTYHAYHIILLKEDIVDIEKRDGIC